MKKEDAKEILRELCNEGWFLFPSEAAFQHLFALKLVEKFGFRHEVVPEWCFVESGKPIYVDIFVNKESPIFFELKYTTRIYSPSKLKENEFFKKLKERDGKFRGILVKLPKIDVEILVRNHGAQDVRRYDFCKDIERLEKLTKALGGKGFAIFLTNDKNYWEEKDTKKDTIDKAFRIYDGRELSGILKWSRKAGKGTIKGRDAPIKLRGHYTLEWEDYFRPEENLPLSFKENFRDLLGKVRMLIVEVSK